MLLRHSIYFSSIEGYHASATSTAPTPHQHSGGLHLPFQHPAWRTTTLSTRGCARHNSDVVVCCLSCSGKFNKPTSCNRPRTSRHARLVQVASDTADILNHLAFRWFLFTPQFTYDIYIHRDDIYIPLIFTPLTPLPPLLVFIDSCGSVLYR